MRADLRRGRGHVARPLAIDQRRLRFVRLGAVDIGPRRTVDDRVGLHVAHGEPHRFGVGDVEVGARERDHVVSGGGSCDDVRAEHARGPRDEKAHGQHQ